MAGPDRRSGQVSPTGAHAIAIKTSAGIISCCPDDIVCKRLGVDCKNQRLILEYLVPARGVRALHVMPVEIEASSDASDSSSTAAAVLARSRLLDQHGPFLRAVDPDQLLRLLLRLSDAESPTATAALNCARRPRRRMELLAVAPRHLARASAKSGEKERRKAFEEMRCGFMGGQADDEVTAEHVEAYVAGYLGFGLAEALNFAKRCGCGERGQKASFESFSAAFSALNPFVIAQRFGEVLVRKPGALGVPGPRPYSPQQVSLDQLDNCEIYVCTVTAQAFVDQCSGCAILLGPCESSVFVRNCSDCIIWVAAQQLRTRECERCTFYLFAKTEPIIESSKELLFAPWCARYPHCVDHFAAAKFDAPKSHWNAIYDFTAEAGTCHWGLPALEEIVELVVEFEGEAVASGAPSPSSPGPAVTYEALCARPLVHEDRGQALAAAPQCRPPLPPRPLSGATTRTITVSDGLPASSSPVGARRLMADAQ